MRTIRTKVYQFSELSEQAKFKAVSEQINFEIEMIEDEHNAFWDAAQEMERMQTPWFLAENIYHDPKLRAIVIEDIEANDYYYLADGTFAPQQPKQKTVA